MASTSKLHELAARGQSIWFDTLSRDLVRTGELKRMMKDDAVTGVTSNPSIFQKALSEGDAYDDDLKKLLEETDDPSEIFPTDQSTVASTRLFGELNTLTDVVDERAEVGTGRPPLLDKDALDERSDAALAVRSCNVDELGPMGDLQPPDELVHAVEPQSPSAVLEA